MRTPEAGANTGSGGEHWRRGRTLEAAAKTGGGGESWRWGRTLDANNADPDNADLRNPEIKNADPRGARAESREHGDDREGAEAPQAAANRRGSLERTATPPSGLDPLEPATALAQAQRLQETVARFGFDWPDPAPVWDKLLEELEELRAAALSEGAERSKKVREEVGDLLFAVVNLARWLDVEAEGALESTNRKFRRRFNRMLELAESGGNDLSGLGLEELDFWWEAAKREEREGAHEDPESTPEVGQGNEVEP